MIRWLSAIGLTAVLLATLGCGTADTLTPANTRVDLASARSVYAQTDSFVGTFTFINKTLRSIRAEFASSQLFDLAFYDSLGVESFHLNMGAYQRITYLELGPLGARTEPLAFPFYQLPRGTYRVRAWVEGHEDIYSEKTIRIGQG